LRRAGNVSRVHQNTHKILKRKKQTDIQYDYTARFGGQRFGKLKVATWNVRGIAEKTEELQTQLLKSGAGNTPTLHAHEHDDDDDDVTIVTMSLNRFMSRAP